MKNWLWRWYWEPFSPDEHSIREQGGIFVRKVFAILVFGSIWTILVCTIFYFLN
jgi:hypothetical protein